MNGDEIIQRRTALGLSRQKLADAAGISHATIWRWETGKVMPHSVGLRVLEQTLAELERKATRNARDRAARAAHRTSTG
jgi:transcriptional regulator with XRE-family HTH domain